MKTANYRWNEKVENFNMKLNQLREEINEYKRNSIPVSFLNNKNAFITKAKYDAKKKEIPIVKNDEIMKTIYKRTNGGCALKEKKNNNNKVIEINNEHGNNKNNSNSNHNSNINGIKKIINNVNNNNNKENVSIIMNKQKNTNTKSNANETTINMNTLNKYANNKTVVNGVEAKTLQLPTTRGAATKFVRTRTNTNTAIINENSLVQNIKDKKKIEKNDKTNKTNKINEKKWIAATRHVKIDTVISNESKPAVEQKRKNKFLYFEGEDGSVQVYPLYADADIGFHNITQLDDENLSQVKRENQDDDDIKTTKRLAEWSSELVYKHLKETVEKSKSFFKNKNAESIREDLIRRMYD